MLAAKLLGRSRNSLKESHEEVGHFRGRRVNGGVICVLAEPRGGVTVRLSLVIVRTPLCVCGLFADSAGPYRVLQSYRVETV